MFKLFYFSVLQYMNDYNKFMYNIDVTKKKNLNNFINKCDVIFQSIALCTYLLFVEYVTSTRSSGWIVDNDIQGGQKKSLCCDLEKKCL